MVRQEGEVVTTGEVIATLEEAQAAAAARAGGCGSEPPSRRRPTEADLEGLSPAVRRLRPNMDLDIAKVAGSGRGGRVTKADVLAFLEGANRPRCRRRRLSPHRQRAVPAPVVRRRAGQRATASGLARPSSGCR
jgi:2-oxoglutarate dehydrogenase E2 component (dihydrolipoamide succinyltransferase)